MDELTKNTSYQHHSDANHPTMNKITNTSDILARRRLMKVAVAAAPAIFTLQSGAARAAISNMECLTKSPKYKATKDLVHVTKLQDDVENPNWVRSEINGVIVQNGERKKKKYALVPLDSGPSLNRKYQDEKGDKWLALFDKDGALGYVKDKDKNKKHVLDPGSKKHKKHFFTQQMDVKRFKLVYVDKEGRYATSDKHGYHPVTTSCWASFA